MHNVILGKEMQEQIGFPVHAKAEVMIKLTFRGDPVEVAGDFVAYSSVVVHLLVS